MAEREETLAKNTVMFAIGSFASKLLQIVLVPFYTRVLTRGEYGTIDILQAIVSLLIPIASLAIYESVFRYAMEKNHDKSAVLSVGMLVCLFGTIVMCILGCILALFISPMYVWLVIANTAANMLWTVLSQYAKAIGRTVLFTVNNVITTVLVLGLNVIFLVLLKMGIMGYMLGYTLANLLSALSIIIWLGSDFKIRLEKINKQLVKEMLIFAVPLLFNGICWWLSSFTDRIMIVSMLGSEENGLYAAASKIPHILAVVVTIFYQAWQVSANQEFESKDISEFYSKTYEQNAAFTFIMASGMILLCRPVASVFLGAEYISSWVFIPPLVLSIVFFSFSQFLCSVYAANKKTKMAFITNIIGMIANIVLNVLLIPLIGAMGAAIATAFSYFVLWLVRIFDTRKVVKMHYNISRTLISIIVLILQAVFICVELDVIITYSLCVAGTVLITILYWDILISILRFCWRFLKKMFKKVQ